MSSASYDKLVKSHSVLPHPDIIHDSISHAIYSIFDNSFIFKTIL